MVVNIPEEHLAVCDKISRELNTHAKKFNIRNYRFGSERFERDLFKRNLTLESKKHLLMKNLNKLLITTFAIDTNKLSSKERFLTHMKKRLGVVRNTVLKLRDINYYLKAILLKELNIGKPKKQKLRHLLREEEGWLTKTDIDRLEVTVHRLIERIIFLDQKLIDKFMLRQLRLVKESKTDVRELEKIIAGQSEMLCHLEAKLPPPNKVNALLLRKKLFTHWVSRIFALLAGLNYEYQGERGLFSELKKNKLMQKKLSLRISTITKEKFAMLKLRERRLLTMDDIKKVEDEHHLALHHYTSALKL